MRRSKTPDETDVWVYVAFDDRRSDHSNDIENGYILCHLHHCVWNTAVGNRIPVPESSDKGKEIM